MVCAREVGCLFCYERTSATISVWCGVGAVAEQASGGLQDLAASPTSTLPPRQERNNVTLKRLWWALPR